MQNYLKLISNTFFKVQMPEMIFELGQAYLIYPLSEDFLETLLLEKIIKKQKVKKQEEVSDDFIQRFGDHSIEDFLDIYDDHNVGEILLNHERKYKLTFKTQINHLDVYDLKCLDLTYIINKSTQRFLFSETIAFSPKSKYRFNQCLPIICKKIGNISIIHLESSKIDLIDNIAKVSSFQFYNLKELDINSVQEFIHFHQLNYG